MSEHGQRSATILVVEDDADIRDMLKSFLGQKGYRVVEAADGEAAVETAQRVLPDLILLDLHLPKLEGTAVARQVRQVPALSTVPIIANSAYGLQGINLFNRLEELGAGPTEYLTKPIDLAELNELLLFFLPSNSGSAL